MFKRSCRSYRIHFYIFLYIFFLCANGCLIGGSGPPYSIDSIEYEVRIFPAILVRGISASGGACVPLVPIWQPSAASGGGPKSLYIHVDERKMILINPLVSP